MGIAKMKTPREPYAIARKISELRKKKGITQVQLASAIDRHQSRVAKWELSEGKPEPGDLLAMAKIFGVPLDYLCDDEAPDPDEADHSITLAAQEVRHVAEVPARRSSPTGSSSGMSDDDEEALALIVKLSRRLGPSVVLDRILGEAGKPRQDQSGVTASPPSSSHVRPHRD
jgi:transcriptional regulator with XRE-family HTH domain